MNNILAWAFRAVVVAGLIVGAITKDIPYILWVFIALIQHERAEAFRRRFMP